MKTKHKYFPNYISILICLYAPFFWVFTINASWSYKLGYIKMFPFLPGICPGIFMVGHVDNVTGMCIMGLFTAITFTLLLLLSKKNRKYLILSRIIALSISIPSSILTYTLFKV